MPNSKDVFQWVVKQITLKESFDEINSIVYLLLKKVLNLSRSQIIASQFVENFNEENLLPFIQRINQGEPIQYIIGNQEFYGRSFLVNPAVLIPRPETELLVEVALSHAKTLDNEKINILDVGTGSGCIPITMQLENNLIVGVGIDISAAAVEVANENNKIHETSIQFEVSDALNDDWPEETFDLILSNPPYITEKEKKEMKSNVLNYEPHTALFVSNNDPLLFYKAIASKSSFRLKPGGLLAFEINESYGKEMINLLNDLHFESIQLHKDINGKDRVISALRAHT